MESRRSTAILLTSVVDLAAAELLREAMLRLERRHQPILVNLQDPEILQLAGGAPENPEGAFAKAAALDIVDANRRLGKRLRKAGVRVVESAADRLALETLEAYLALVRQASKLKLRPITAVNTAELNAAAPNTAGCTGSQPCFNEETYDMRPFVALLALAFVSSLPAFGGRNRLVGRPPAVIPFPPSKFAMPCRLVWSWWSRIPTTRAAHEQRWTVQQADAESVTIEYANLNGEGAAVGEPMAQSATWIALRNHASFPSAHARREEASRETALGKLDGWLYTVQDPKAGTVSELFFATDHPGAPVHMTVSQRRHPADVDAAGGAPSFPEPGWIVPIHGSSLEVSRRIDILHPQQYHHG